MKCPLRGGRESQTMAASRAVRRNTRRAHRARKSSAVVRRPAKSAKSRMGHVAKPEIKPLVRAILSRQPAAPPEQVLYRICKPGWSVIVEKTPNAQGTRFVCPFCTVSHRVPGPVRGFRKLRRANWVKLRRVEE
jgi:hypothetical protein